MTCEKYIEKMLYVNVLFNMKLIFGIYFCFSQRIGKEKLKVEDDGTYGEISTIPLHEGPATSLQPQLEQEIRLFIEDCYHIGIPRCKGKLAVDIQEYLIRNQINVKSFVDQKPGTFNNCFVNILLDTLFI